MLDQAQRANGAAKPDPLDGLPAFQAAVRARLERGRVTYRDESFHRDPAVILGELAQEALDLAGWGYVLWRRVQTLAAESAGKLEEPGDG